MCVPLIFDLFRFVSPGNAEINTPENKRIIYVRFTRGAGFPKTHTQTDFMFRVRLDVVEFFFSSIVLKVHSTFSIIIT